MYEAPKLTRVGEAHEVVLGGLALGEDFDGRSIDSDMLFAEESLPDEE